MRSRRIDGFKGYPRKDERGDEDGDDEASEEMTTTGQERYESEERETLKLQSGGEGEAVQPLGSGTVM